jgi:flagellar M-ring protein FliF
MGHLARVRWAQMAAEQRGMGGGQPALSRCSALAGGLAWYALSPDWRTSMSNLDPDDARQMGQILAQAQIPFRATGDGAGIDGSRREQLDKARLAYAAAKGGVKSGRLGFEIFDKPNWVGSEFDEQVNYQRALEGELEHTVGTLSDIESARVHLVLPHDSLFREEERPCQGLRGAQAAPVRSLGRRRTGGDPQSGGLGCRRADSPDHVVLVDAAGNLPLGPRRPPTRCD